MQTYVPLGQSKPCVNPFVVPAAPHPVCCFIILLPLESSADETRYLHDIQSASCPSDVYAESGTEKAASCIDLCFAKRFENVQDQDISAPQCLSGGAIRKAMSSATGEQVDA